MREYNRGAFQVQIGWIRQQFAQHESLPFSHILTAQTIRDTLNDIGLRFYDSLYNPVTVLWLFLGQVIHANPTLGVTVEFFNAWRLGHGLAACSSQTGAYARARKRLPESLLAKLTQSTGTELERSAPDGWRWLGRVVKIFDGSTISMDDTPENQKAFPQSRQQAPGVGFPIARIGVLFSLSVGTVLDLGFRRFAGKFQSELAIFRDMLKQLDPQDVVLSDRYLCSFMEIALLRQRGVDFVGRMNATRHVDFRRGQKLGRYDHVVTWERPRRPDWMSPTEYAAIPPTMMIREVCYDLIRPGYRPCTITIATTLLDAEQYPVDDLADLYRFRWDAEIHLRSLKQTMQMDVIHCQTPEMVRKAVWAHLLAYNLVRTVIAQAAIRHGELPRHISFTRAMRTLESFRMVLAFVPSNQLPNMYEEMLQAIASQQVGQRPHRLEPRLLKRRSKPYKLMQQPRPASRNLERQKR